MDTDISYSPGNFVSQREGDYIFPIAPCSAIIIFDLFFVSAL